MHQSQEQITVRIEPAQIRSASIGWFFATPGIENQYYSFRNGAHLSFKYGFYSELLNNRLR